ncbi:MAG: glutaredoxin family protein [Rhodocyclaceae bacterium]|nr:glutaredoxin family protein [Rhodocyclaceae bacterium]MBX3668375.1 glutaredoxin family protein [Rhodocyclaceae bacterium]
MRTALEPILAEFKVELQYFDVDDDPALEERLGELVPVLMAGTRELCHYFLDAAAVRAHLRGIG